MKKVFYIGLLFIVGCVKEDKTEKVLPITNPDLLVNFLSDPDSEIRHLAAFHIGQSRDSNYASILTNAFDNKDTLGTFANANAAILEALGKLGNIETLKFIASISSYRDSDTALHVGRLSSLYEFGLRNLITEEGTNLAFDYISNFQLPAKSRLYAAHYLARIKDIDLHHKHELLSETIKKETDPFIKMALVTAAGRLSDPSIVATLVDIIKNDYNSKTVINAIKSLGQFNYDLYKNILLDLLNHPNRSFRNLAADIIIKKGNPSDSFNYYEIAKSQDDISTKILMLRASLKYLPTSALVTREAAENQLFKIFKSTENPHLRASTLEALSENKNMMPFIKTNGISDQAAIVRKTTMQLLREKNELNEEFLDSNDPSILFEASFAFNAQNEKAKNLAKIAISNLKMPDNLETAMALSSILDEPVPLMEHYYFNKPKLGEYNFAEIKTNVGSIKIEFFNHIAPITIQAFISLIEDNFYNGLLFHRVVPNFVIQGGCPFGSGLGSSDFLLKTETGPIYYDIPGRVGMASAGSGTEGSQFFITHSPTPHLNGKYTIFAQVIEGQEVVDLISEGDYIEQIILK
jgi:cyclophilin family peptidyl-prolyl cis-trans isomerase/HEAT repeat protein